MEKLLITDIDNFIGLHLKQKFYETYEIFDLGCDIMDFAAVEHRINQIRPNYIIHICQQHNIKNRYQQDNLGTKTYQGTVNLIRAAKNLDCLRLFTFHSIYSNQTSLWDYSKFLCEKIFEHESKDGKLPYCILKLPTIFGDYRRPLLFNIGQPISEVVTFKTDDLDFKIEDIVFEMKNKRKIVVDKNKDYKVLFIDDLITLYELIFSNIENFQNTKHIVPFGEDTDLKALIACSKLILAQKIHIDICIEDEDVVKSDVVEVSSLDWKPIMDLRRGVINLINRINHFDKEFNGL